MTPELLARLRAWGQASAVRFVRVEATRVAATAAHPLDRAREYAPGTRERAAARLAGRDGRSRLSIMGRAAGRVTLPRWSCDPVPCSETRKRAPRESVADAARSTGVVDIGLPDHLLSIESAVVRMGRVSPIMEHVVRVEFCEEGSQRRKAGVVASRHEVSISLGQYKRVLAKALAWLAGAT